jgi:hypothetical protein
LNSALSLLVRRWTLVKQPNTTLGCTWGRVHRPRTPIVNLKTLNFHRVDSTAIAVLTLFSLDANKTFWHVSRSRREAHVCAYASNNHGSERSRLCLRKEAITGSLIRAARCLIWVLLFGSKSTILLSDLRWCHRNCRVFTKGTLHELLNEYSCVAARCHVRCAPMRWLAATDCVPGEHLFADAGPSALATMLLKPLL